MKEGLIQLIQKYSEGKLSLQEQIEISEQLANQGNDAVEELLKKDWEKQLESTDISEKQLQPVLNRIHHQIRLNESSKQSSRSLWQSFQRIAAILILPLMLSFLAYAYFQSNRPKPLDSFAEIQCPMGARIKFQLPDGTTGFLNSGSILKYSSQFADTRNVELSGEAYFEVVHNEKMPFHILTKNLDITDLGTKFDVIANEDENTEEIILQSGEVSIASKTGTKLADLKPNEQLTLNTDNRTFTKNSVEAAQYSSWKEGKLAFRNENMQQVAKRLSRWYNADVVVDDSQLNNYTFHATFQDEPLEEVLKLLSLTTPLSFSEEKRVSNQEGVFSKRKVILKINQSRINQFK